MELIAYTIALSGFALACAAVGALWEDNFALRIAARLIARVEARRAARERYAIVLAEREHELGLPQLWPAREGAE